MEVDQVLLLLLLLFTKHYFIDFLLQSEEMSTQKGKRLHLLLLHAFEHGVGTLVILVFFCPWQIALFLSTCEAVIHMFIDFTKAHPKLLGKYSPPSTIFFNLLGLDQLLHYFTYLGIAYYISLISS